MSNSLTDRDIDMRRCTAILPISAPSSPISPVSALIHHPGAFWLFSRHRYTTLPFCFQRHNGTISWRRLPVKFFCNMSEMILARCASSGAQKLSPDRYFLHELYDRCDVHELQVPRQLKVHHQLKRFNIQTTPATSVATSTRALPLAKRTRVDRDRVAPNRRVMTMHFALLHQRVADSLAIFFGIAKHHARDG